MGKNIVVNKCFGGFGLSDAGIKEYARLKGLTLYPEKDRRYSMITYWTVPKDKRPKLLSDKEWVAATLEERCFSNEAHDAAQLYDRDIPRDDPLLVQAVQNLGEAANGEYARLVIVEIPDDVEWDIDEYDGQERVSEKHRTW